MATTVAAGGDRIADGGTATYIMEDRSGAAATTTGRITPTTMAARASTSGSDTIIVTTIITAGIGGKRLK